MSRYAFDIDDERYAVVGWDRPLQSLFWQIWNGKDERRMIELERRDTDKDTDELECLYEKYQDTGGEPVIADSGLGGHRITSVIDLQKELKDYCVIPAELSRQLILDMQLDIG